MVACFATFEQLEVPEPIHASRNLERFSEYVGHDAARILAAGTLNGNSPCAAVVIPPPRIL
jgi:hypothetical protein